MMAVDRRHELQVSRHGERRARQRVGLPKRAVERNAQRALVEGIGYREASGALRRYISWLYELYDGNGNNIRIYNGYVYVFHDTLLITVLFVPLEHRKRAEAAQKKRRNDFESALGGNQNSTV
jgi:hypothetical protein